MILICYLVIAFEYWLRNGDLISILEQVEGEEEAVGVADDDNDDLVDDGEMTMM